MYQPMWSRVWKSEVIVGIAGPDGWLAQPDEKGVQGEETTQDARVEGYQQVCQAQ